VACAVFAFVAFIFGVVNPRREKFTGVFFALVMIFWYYVLNAIAKNLGYNGVIRPPELAAWLTNIGFLLLATLLFLRMR
ncbi:MAG TPA: LptF/LptG family permease, partial [bacterium]|nr:LptF/LptG family permease [bacterium]